MSFTKDSHPWKYPLTSGRTFIESVQDSEGFSDTPYKDSEGYWTVGYGHRLQDFTTLDHHSDTHYPKDQLAAWLVEDLENAQKQAKIFLYRKSITLSPIRFTVLVEMAFILGYVGAKQIYTVFLQP